MYLGFSLQVAKDLSLEEVSQTWLILKLLYCGDNPECSRMGLLDTMPSSRAATGSRLSSVASVSRRTIPVMEDSMQ